MSFKNTITKYHVKNTVTKLPCVKKDVTKVALYVKKDVTKVACKKGCHKSSTTCKKGCHKSSM